MVKRRQRIAASVWFTTNKRKNFSESLPIKKSEAQSWINDDSHRDYAPEKAYDGDDETAYLTKDGDVEVNFLKLYLLKKHRIGTVKLTNRGDCCQERIIGTAVMVYSTEGGNETKVGDCGEISETGMS